MVLVGETPGFHEEVRGEPFVGQSGKALNEILSSTAISRTRLWITNTILCRPEVPGVQGPKRYDFKTYLAWIRKQNMERKKAAHVGKKKGEHVHWEPISSPIDCCSPRLWIEIARFDAVARERGDVNGIVVMPLGNYAAEAVVGKTGIMKLRGSPFDVDLADPKGHLFDERLSVSAQEEQVKLRHPEGEPCESTSDQNSGTEVQ